MISLLADILGDRVSGASALYRKTITLLLSDNRYQQPAQWKSILQRLRRRFPEMAVFAYLEERLQKTPPEEMADCLRHLAEQADDEVTAIGRHLDRRWKKPRRIVTVSRSSVVTRVLRERSHKITGIVVSRSAPHQEGIMTARAFAAAGVEVSLVVDAALPGMIEKDDWVIVGADCVTENHVVNKTGTFAVALAARNVGARTVALFERFKRVSEKRFPFSPSDQPPSEIRRRPGKGITIRNIYFEQVPRHMFDWLISGEGIESGNQPANACRSRKR